MNIRTAAIVAGRTRYSSGKPCRKGHISDRYSSNGMCVECVTARQALCAANTAKWREEKRRAFSEHQQITLTVHVKPHHADTVRACAAILNSGDADSMVAFVDMMRT